MCRASLERGSLVIEFLGAVVVGIAGLLLVAQMGLWVWAHNITVTAVAEGAWLAAQDGGEPSEGAERARVLIRAGLGSGGDSFRVVAERRSGSVVVRARGRAPAVLHRLVTPPIDARAVARREDLVRR